MSAYFVANIKIHDEAEYQKYLNDVDSVFDKYNGKYLILDDNPKVLEGEWVYSRFVLIQFPDKESLEKWYYSEEYQAILKHRLAGAICDTIIAGK